MALLLFLLWILLSGELTVGVCVTGALFSVALELFCRRILGYRKSAELAAVRKAPALILYVVELVWEMLKAGFAVMRLIYTKGRGTEPLLVRFDTRLRDDRARAALANSITLTAGTITVSAEDGHLYVHTLDRALAEGLAQSCFERRLQKLEERA